MSTTAINALSGPKRLTGSLRLTTVTVGAAAAAVTTALAATIHAAGVALAAGGQIPLAGFAQLTFVATVAGGLIVAVLNRRSSAPRQRFVQTTAALTGLSCAAPIVAGSGAGSKLALVGIHLAAAAIVIPFLARHAEA